MSCSKHLPPFTYDLLFFLNREQLERFVIICRPMKNLIERYFNSKPYRIFDILVIRGRLYGLIHNYVQWHLNRDDYNVQHFLAGQNCSIDKSEVHYPSTYYSFAEIHPYIGPTVRINRTIIVVAGDSTYNAEHIAEMASIAYLRQNGNIMIWYADEYHGKYRIVAEDFQPILNSPIILQCQHLSMSFFTAVLPSAFKVVFMQDDESLTEFRATNNTSGEKLELKKALPVEYQEKYLKKYHNYTLERSTI